MEPKIYINEEAALFINPLTNKMLMARMEDVQKAVARLKKELDTLRETTETTLTMDEAIDIFDALDEKFLKDLRRKENRESYEEPLQILRPGTGVWPVNTRPLGRGNRRPYVCKG